MEIQAKSGEYDLTNRLVDELANAMTSPHLFIFPSYRASFFDEGDLDDTLQQVEELQSQFETSTCSWVLPADADHTSWPFPEAPQVLPLSFLSSPGELFPALHEWISCVGDSPIIVLQEPSDAVLISMHDVLCQFPKGELILLHPEGLSRHRPKSEPMILHEPLAFYTRSSRDTKDEIVQKYCQQVGLLAESAAMREQVDAAAILATHQVPVLILGETGTGKSLLARFIHQAGSRSRSPMVSLNCAALPDKLAESILFGHRKGAFTGAVDHQDGMFREAHQGTLFLDEVGELSLEVQAKLLRVLEDGYIQPVGATKGGTVDVRILAATNRDLQTDVAEGRFREDLFHRLSFGVLRLPPLSERPDDIEPLARRFLKKFNPSLAEPRTLSPEALEYLVTKAWPGNVRELEHAVGRSALYAQHQVITRDDFSRGGLPPSAPLKRSEPATIDASFSLEEHLKVARETLIQRALEQSHGNQSAAARLLGISPQAVHKFLKNCPESNPNRN